MKNIIIKKDVIEIEKENFITNLPFDDIKKDYLRTNIDADAIFSFFINIESPDQLKGLNFKDLPLETLNDYVSFSINVIKVNILTALLKSAMFLHFISEDMSFDDKINLLIDLKNLDDIQTLQNLIANTLEKDLTSNL